jgi:hypothetical protein
MDEPPALNDREEDLLGMWNDGVVQDQIDERGFYALYVGQDEKGEPDFENVTREQFEAIEAKNVTHQQYHQRQRMARFRAARARPPPVRRADPEQVRQNFLDGVPMWRMDPTPASHETVQLRRVEKSIFVTSLAHRKILRVPLLASVRRDEDLLSAVAHGGVNLVRTMERKPPLPAPPARHKFHYFTWISQDDYKRWYEDIPAKITPFNFLQHLAFEVNLDEAGDVPEPTVRSAPHLGGWSKSQLRRELGVSRKEMAEREYDHRMWLEKADGKPADMHADSGSAFMRYGHEHWDEPRRFPAFSHKYSSLVLSYLLKHWEAIKGRLVGGPAADPQNRAIAQCFIGKCNNPNDLDGTPWSADKLFRMLYLVKEEFPRQTWAYMRAVELAATGENAKLHRYAHVDVQYEYIRVFEYKMNQRGHALPPNRPPNMEPTRFWYCFDRDKVARMLNDPDNRRQEYKEFRDDEGHGGHPHGPMYVLLEATLDVKLLLDLSSVQRQMPRMRQRVPTFRLLPVSRKSVRYGNVDGSFGVSEDHGQASKVAVPYTLELVPMKEVMHDMKCARDEKFKQEQMAARRVMRPDPDAKLAPLRAPGFWPRWLIEAQLPVVEAMRYYLELENASHELAMERFNNLDTQKDWDRLMRAIRIGRRKAAMAPPLPDVLAPVLRVRVPRWTDHLPVQEALAYAVQLRLGRDESDIMRTYRQLETEEDWDDLVNDMRKSDNAAPVPDVLREVMEPPVVEDEVMPRRLDFDSGDDSA